MHALTEAVAGSRPEQAAQDVSPYVLNDFRRAVPAMRRGGFGNSCRNCAALVPAYLFSVWKSLTALHEGVALNQPRVEQREYNERRATLGYG